MKRFLSFPRNIHRRIAASYILAFGIIAVCLVSMFLSVHWMLETQKSHLDLARVNGQQLMLTQKIASLADQWTHAEPNEAVERTRTSLLNHLNQFESTLDSFDIYEAEIVSSPKYLGSTSLTGKARQFLNLNRSLVSRDTAPRDRNRIGEEVEQLANNQLMPGLLAESEQLKSASVQSIDAARQTQSLLFLITLIVLVFEAIFIFQPILNANEKIDFVANHDPLTQLPNRRMLAQKADAALRESRRNGHSIGFMHLDLDLFKSVNDTLGHGAGDEVLRSVAETLRFNLRSERLIARIGGDEFAVLFTDVKSVDELVGPAQRLIDKIRIPIPYKDKNCIIGCSIGLAISGEDEVDFERVLMDADIALYEAKSSGRNQYQIITEELRGRFERKEKVIKEIRDGIERDEFLPWFQPQIDSNTGRITGVEALARWNKGGGTLEKNTEFIRLADEIGVLAEIDQQILHKSLSAFVEWRRSGIQVPGLSLNFSVRQLEQPDFVTELHAVTSSYGLEPGDISIEILESVFFDDRNRFIVENIEQLSSSGFTIELDDFGTGHTAVTSLLDLPIDRIKLDRSLIRDIENGGAGETITRTMIALARELDIETLAEGVETARQVAALKQIGCTIHQGFYYARPMSMEAFSKWCASRNPRQATPPVTNTTMPDPSTRSDGCAR